jgi:hypothetical protein
MTAELSKFTYDTVLYCEHESAHVSVSGHLRTRWALCGQQRELRSKCSEMKKGGGGGKLGDCFIDPLCGPVVTVSGYRYRGPGFDSQLYYIF